MKLDILLSKYLDGELTSEEDRELRQMLSQNPEAKQTFDASIALHMALRHDADKMVPPAQLIRETEEQILMKILNQPAPQRTQRRISFFLPTSALMGIIVAALMPILTHNIGIEKVFTSASQPVQSGEFSYPVVKDNLLIDRAVHQIKSEKRTLKKNGEKMLSAPVFADATIRQKENAALATLQAASFQRNDVDISERDMGKDNVSIISFAKQDETSLYAQESFFSGNNSFRSGNNPSSVSSTVFGGNLFSGLLSQSNIHISTTFGTNLIAETAPGQPKTGLSFVSQSLAYTMGEDERAGLELGYMWFTYIKPIVSFIPATGTSVKPGDKNAVPDESDGSDPTSQEGGQYIYTQQPMGKQTFWGAAFYERTLYRTEKINVQTRAGLGGSNDGVLGYVRAVGLYNVISNMSLSVGFDARGMMLKTPYLSPKSHSMQMGLSFIYGLEFHF